MFCTSCGGDRLFTSGRCSVCGAPGPAAADNAATTLIKISDEDGETRVPPARPSAADAATALGLPERDDELATGYGTAATPPTAAEAATLLGLPERDDELATGYGTAATTAYDLPSTQVDAIKSGTAAAPVRRRKRSVDMAGPLEVGQTFGPRYHIIRLLGAGGMGAVYQAWDAELEVAVAIKVIRPDAMADPSTALEVERRFKRELLLARQVTHRNVVRIHDI